MPSGYIKSKIKLIRLPMLCSNFGIFVQLSYHVHIIGTSLNLGHFVLAGITGSRVTTMLQFVLHISNIILFFIQMLRISPQYEPPIYWPL